MGLDRQRFGLALSSERKRLTLQVNDVAEACEIKPGTQYLYEQGKRVPNADYLDKVFELGFRPHVLLPSATQANDQFDIQHLRNAFMRADQECRDKEGRLLDLEHRVSRFLDLPVSLVTDSKEYLENTFGLDDFDKIIPLLGVDTASPYQRTFFDGAMSHRQASFKNTNRYQ